MSKPLRAHPEAAAMESRYFNRELSLLDFEERVLAVAENPNVPILERVRFVAIVASGLDEFFQVRVAELLERRAVGMAGTSDRMTPAQQLTAIRERYQSLMERLERLMSMELVTGLAEAGIYLAAWSDLPPDEKEELVALYQQEVYPVLTPLGFDPAHPFPFISNLSLNLGVSLRNPKTGESQFARVKVPPLLPRFLSAGDRPRFVPVEQVIAAHLDTLFPGMEIISHHPFRVTRSAELDPDESETYDLLEAMQELLHTRHRFSRVVRLEVDDTMTPEILGLLTTRLGLDASAVYVSKRLLALTGLATIYALDRPDLKHPTWVPTTQPALAKSPDQSIFDRIRERDVLVHLPYDAFSSSVGAFIAEAAADPQVVAIKQTLYRTSDPDDPALGGETSIVQSLMHASRAGKQVAVLVELMARFDEEANINWARMLEEAGVHVVYGVAGLKTHAKIALVVRREGRRLVRYSHIGTGNYNPKTAHMYEDIGLLTDDEDIGADLSELFNVLTGYSGQQKYRKLLVAPASLRRDVISLIRSQAAHKGGSILMKLNHLADPQIIDELYRASQRGTRIDLVVRGACCIRPGRPGLSERIRVRSIVGKYLEHSRIMRFGEGEQATYLIGSADMMARNLNRRVEAFIAIEDPALRLRIEEVLRICLADDSLAWDLDSDGAWRKAPTIRGVNAHLVLEDLALARAQGVAPDPASADSTAGVVMAAGGIATRVSTSGRTEILVVHRPAHQDWSFPKGKIVDGEVAADAAAREVLEETGFRCSLGSEIGTLEHRDRDGSRKVVRYWEMSPESGRFTPNDEVDQIRWLPPDKALRLLSYDRDRALLRHHIDRGHS
jgi:polyphosphate kinase